MRPSIPGVAVVLTAAMHVAVPAPANAEDTASCHCFRDRAYDPLSPAAADPYILATTRSSTLAAALGADKASLVRSAMTGTSADDIWVAWWAGSRTGRDPGSLLEARRRAASWKPVFAADDRARLGAAMRDELMKAGSSARLAAIAVDDVAVSHLRADRDVVRATRAAGAGSPELILTLLLAPRLKLGPPEILALARGGRSWGALLNDAGVAPSDIDEVVKAAVAPRTTQEWLLR